MDVVFTFSFESLEDAVQRGMGRPPDRLLATLLRDSRVGRLLVADPFRSAPVRIVRRLAEKNAALPPRPQAYRVRPLRFRRHDPASLRSLRRGYSSYERRLERAVLARSLQAPAVITFNPFVAAFCRLEWARSVTYYARDDWSTYPMHHRLRAAHELAMLRIREGGRRVCAVSQVLLDRIAPTGPSAVVPNGIDPEEWRGRPTVPDWYRELPRPIALYAGSIDGRLDADAVGSVARALDRGTVVLVGPVLDEGLHERFSDSPNVVLAGRHSRLHVAGMIRTSDVCLVPHLRSDLTEAMSPLKLFEYYAGGRPVVATDLPPIRSAGGGALLVSDPGTWSAAVHEALALGPAREDDRRAFIDAHRWGARHEDVLELALA